MSPTSRPELRVGWCRSDRVALTVLLAVWAGALAWSWRSRPAPVAGCWALAESVRETVDPNTASAASLRRLPGIGPVLADAIVSYRLQAGRPRPAFARVADLRNVPGIGPKKAGRIEPYLAPAVVRDPADHRP